MLVSNSPIGKHFLHGFIKIGFYRLSLVKYLVFHNGRVPFPFAYQNPFTKSSRLKDYHPVFHVASGSIFRSQYIGSLQYNSRITYFFIF